MLTKTLILECWISPAEFCCMPKLLLLRTFSAHSARGLETELRPTEMECFLMTSSTRGCNTGVVEEQKGQCAGCVCTSATSAHTAVPLHHMFTCSHSAPSVYVVQKVHRADRGVETARCMLAWPFSKLSGRPQAMICLRL